MDCDCPSDLLTGQENKTGPTDPVDESLCSLLPVGDDSLSGLSMARTTSSGVRSAKQILADYAPLNREISRQRLVRLLYLRVLHCFNLEKETAMFDADKFRRIQHIILI